MGAVSPLPTKFVDVFIYKKIEAWCIFNSILLEFKKSFECTVPIILSKSGQLWRCMSFATPVAGGGEMTCAGCITRFTKWPAVYSFHPPCYPSAQSTPRHCARGIGIWQQTHSDRQAHHLDAASTRAHCPHQSSPRQATTLRTRTDRRRPAGICWRRRRPRRQTTASSRPCTWPSRVSRRPRWRPAPSRRAPVRDHTRSPAPPRRGPDEFEARRGPTTADGTPAPDELRGRGGSRASAESVTPRARRRRRRQVEELRHSDELSPAEVPRRQRTTPASGWSLTAANTTTTTTMNTSLPTSRMTHPSPPPSGYLSYPLHLCHVTGNCRQWTAAGHGCSRWMELTGRWTVYSAAGCRRRSCAKGDTCRPCSEQRSQGTQADWPLAGRLSGPTTPPRPSLHTCTQKHVLHRRQPLHYTSAVHLHTTNTGRQRVKLLYIHSYKANKDNKPQS